MHRRTSEQIMLAFGHVWDCFDAARAAQVHFYDKETFAMREDLLTTREEMRAMFASREIAATQALNGIRAAWADCLAVYKDAERWESNAARQFLANYNDVVGRNYMDDVEGIRALK